MLNNKLCNAVKENNIREVKMALESANESNYILELNKSNTNGDFLIYLAIKNNNIDIGKNDLDLRYLEKNKENKDDCI